MIVSSCEPKPRTAHLKSGPVSEPRGGGGLRLAVLTSHPVQYFAPVFKQLAGRPEVDLTVIYCSLGGATVHFDQGFGLAVMIGLLALLLKSYGPVGAASASTGAYVGTMLFTIGYLVSRRT
jgi:hypothetical protein